MTDLSQPGPVFHVALMTEPVETDMFGTVTVHEIASRRISALYAQSPPEDSGEGFGFSLLCETCSGPNGERFTPDILAGLPNRALKDMSILLRTAVRLNGISKDEVEKA